MHAGFDAAAVMKPHPRSGLSVGPQDFDYGRVNVVHITITICSSISALTNERSGFQASRQNPAGSWSRNCVGRAPGYSSLKGKRLNILNATDLGNSVR